MAFIALANVKPEDVAGARNGIAGEAITSGNVIRNTEASLLIADSAAVGTSDMLGVALNTSILGGGVLYALPGQVITTTSTLSPGQAYYLGKGVDEGKVGLHSDVAAVTAGYATLVGIALDASRLFLIGKATLVVAA